MQTNQGKTKSSRVTKNPNPRHASQTNNTNTTEHELKYLEASQSSLLKLVFGKVKPIEAIPNNYNPNLFTTMVNLMN